MFQAVYYDLYISPSSTLILIIIYSTGVWQPLQIWNQLKIMVKKAVRIISFEDRYSPSTPLFKKLNILPLIFSVKSKLAKFMWKFFNDNLPTTLSENFRTNSRTFISHYESRLSSLEKFVVFEGPKIWNEIPDSIKRKPSLKTFSKLCAKKTQRFT